MDVFEDLRRLADKKKADQMAAYMKDQFSFLGVQTPDRRRLSGAYFKTLNDRDFDWDFVFSCWDLEEREYQYLATDYLKRYEKKLTRSDLSNLKVLITKKSWWDTVDGLVRPLGNLALREPQLNESLLQWSLDENFWLRRAAILHQLLRKEKMDTLLLEKILLNNLFQEEFFINKAMGWILRDYSKTNPEWVRSFLKTHTDGLSALTIREASRYI